MATLSLKDNYLLSIASKKSQIIIFKEIIVLKKLI